MDGEGDALHSEPKSANAPFVEAFTRNMSEPSSPSSSAAFAPSVSNNSIRQTNHAPEFNDVVDMLEAEKPSVKTKQEDEVMTDAPQDNTEISLVFQMDNNSSRNEESSSSEKVSENQNVISPKKDATKNTDDASVEILTPQQAQREWRRKRRRQLKKILNVPKPSFLSLLQQPIEILDDDGDGKEEGTNKIVIDVDEYLGLGKKHSLLPPAVISSYTSPESEQPLVASSTAQRPTPQEEGYYEGARIMALPEDEIYVSELQQWILKNLEFFSATEIDEQMSQSGRRARAVKGKVGVRCIHCSRALLSRFQSKLWTTQMKYEQWPPGSVSYPKDVTGLYSSCSQRPQLHFEQCPNMPHGVIMEGSRFFVHESKFNLTGHGPPVKRRRLKEGISGLMYYHIICQRIGVAETTGGLRFTRDLSLEPLPVEEIRRKVEEERPELLPRQQGRRPGFSTLPRPDGAVSSASATPMVKRACSDEACQKVIQRALEEPDDTENRPACKIDHSMVSDYTFLAMKQMEICHANSLDFVSRGKKTKALRLGFAGFCCRHCNKQNLHVNACRSFSAAADNLASSISNSFVLHLAKCPRTPNEIKQALVTLKKSHSRQLSQMPYGSQRKCFLELWNRMRAADKIVEGENFPEMAQQERVTPSPVKSNYFNVAPIETAYEENRKNSRVANYPVSSNESTLKVLKEAEDNWDPADNNNLMTKEDRSLVSDYVFLTMRQLKVAVPSKSDFRGNRRNNILTRMAGMCCLHCADSDTFVSSGRTFPSAPDNMASAFNTSLYNHMQHCPMVPMEFKSAFQDLKRIHSVQCQTLVFGSQRKFFNKVYDKLKLVPIPKELITAATEQSPVAPSKRSAGKFANAITLREYSFVMGEEMGGFPQYWQCIACRAVPLDFRAPGAFHTSCPTTLAVQQHARACCKNGLFLGFLNRARGALIGADKSLLEKLTFKKLVRVMTRHDDKLSELFSGLLNTAEDTTGWWKRFPSSVEFEKVQEVFGELAAELDFPSSRLQDHPRWVRFLQLLSPSFHCPIAEKNNGGNTERTTLRGGLPADLGAKNSDKVGVEQDNVGQGARIAQSSNEPEILENQSDESDFDEVLV